MSTIVAFFLPSLEGGGAERVLLRLAGGLVGGSQGTGGVSAPEVDLVVAGQGGVLRDQIPPGVNLVELGARRVLTSVPALARYLRRRRPNSLFSALAHANIAAVLARALSGVECRVFVSERLVFSPFSSEAPIKFRLVSRFRRFFYQRAAGVVAVSEGVADDLAASTGLAREDIRVLYNPVVTPGFQAMAEEQPEHPWLRGREPHLSERRIPRPQEQQRDAIPVILAVGRLKRPKAYPKLLDAFARLRRERPARLLILGEGEEREALERQVAELGLVLGPEGDVDLPGFAINPYAYMARADLFVLASDWEGLPGVLIEAMAAGCPVVSTDCRSGPREILRGGELAPLVPTGDPEALAEAMASALADPPSTEALRERAADFSLERIMPAYRRLLVKSAGESRR